MKTPVEQALQWLNEYVRDSRRFLPQFLETKFAVGHLRPLLDVAPFVPPSKSRFYLLSSFDHVYKKNGGRLVKANRVLSVTTLSKKADWDDLAMELGYDEAYVVNEVVSMKILVSYEWAASLAGALGGTKDPITKEFVSDTVGSMKHQEEMIGFVARNQLLSTPVFKRRF